MRIFDKIKNHIDENLINKLFPYIILVYFLLCLLPYISVPILPLYHFLIKSPVNIILRFVSSFIFVVYFALVFIIKQPKISKLYLLCSSFIFLIISISLFVSPREYSSIVNTPPYAYSTLFAYQIGWIDLMGGFASSIVDLIFGYLFIFVLPCIATKDNLKIIVYTILFISLLEILYSLIVEYKKYSEILYKGNSDYGGYDIDIRSTFISKNQFGAFLFMGFVSGFVAIDWYCNKRIFKIFICCITFFIAMAIILTLCKTAIISMVVFLLFYFVFLIYGLIKKRKFRILIPVIVGLSLLGIFVIVLCTTNLHNLGLFKNVVSLLNSTFIKAFEDRFYTWSVSLKMLNSYHIILGYPKGTLLYALSMNTNNHNSFAHNGFIQQSLYYGLFGFLFLILIYVILIVRIVHWKTQIVNKKIYISTLISVFAFMMTESEIFIISSSLLVYLFNLIFTTIPFSGKEITICEKTI